jgi:hypothetical protein
MGPELDPGCIARMLETSATVVHGAVKSRTLSGRPRELSCPHRVRIFRKFWDRSAIHSRAMDKVLQNLRTLSQRPLT